MIKIRAGILALLFSVFAAGVASAQDPSPSPSPYVPIWTVTGDFGPATVSTNGSTNPYVLARGTVSGQPWPKLTIFGRGDVTRTPNGNGFTIQEFSKDFASAEAGLGFRYRLGNSPVSVGLLGGATYSREDTITSPRDPRLWTAEAFACIEKFSWWPDGGLGCLGIGHRGPVGGLAVSVSVTQPISGPVSLVVDFDVPFDKLPEFARALPGALQGVPLTGPPTPEQIQGIAQKLPIAIKASVVVRGFTWKF